MRNVIEAIRVAGLVAAAMTSLARAEAAKLESARPSIRLAEVVQPTLPGGASSLSETYKDWQVSCVQQGTTRRCVISQQQINAQNRQRVLAIEINAAAGNKAEGILVLPFGLMLDAGIKLQVDDGASGSMIRYRTCLASGCLIPVSFDAAMLASLRKATALKVLATADGGVPAPFSLSLQGFGPALDRIVALSK